MTINLEAALGILTAVVAIVGWLVRLEARTNASIAISKENKEEIKNSQKNIELLREKQHFYESQLLEKINKMQVSIGEIKGKLGLSK